MESCPSTAEMSERMYIGCGKSPGVFQPRFAAHFSACRQSLHSHHKLMRGSLPQTSIYNDHNRIRLQALFSPLKYIYLHNSSIRAYGYGAGPTFTPRTNLKSSRSRRADRCVRGPGFRDRRPLPPLRPIRRVPRGRCRRRTSNRGGRE